MSDPADTAAEDLLRASEIAKQAGLHFVYAGNLPGRVGDLENTRCFHCGYTLISRHGYYVEEYSLTPNGCCPKCSNAVPGRWAETPAGVLRLPVDGAATPSAILDFIEQKLIAPLA